MTESRIVSAIMNYVTSSRGVGSSVMYTEQVADEVDTLRERLIRDKESAGQLHSPYQGFGQNLREIIVERTDEYALKVVLPRMYVTGHGLPALAYIGGTDGKSPYRIMTGSQYLNAKHDLFTGSFPFAVYNEGTWELYNTTAERISIRGGIFLHPRQIEPWGYNAGYDDEAGEGDDYPVPGDMADQIIGKTAESYLRTMYRMPPQANTQSDVPVIQPPKK